MLKILVRYMRRSKYISNIADYEPQIAKKTNSLKDSLQDSDLKFHGNILQSTPGRTVIFTEYIFSRWILVNNVLTRFIIIHILF